MGVVKVVVTGGTGFVGRALVAALASRGDDVVVLSRSAREPENDRVRTVAWTPGRGGPWTQSLGGAGAVVNLAGAGLFDERWTPDRLAEIRHSRVDATRALARALTNECPDAVFVSGSAVGMYGMRSDDVVLDEGSPHGTDDLAKLCEEWEGATEPARAAGMRVVCARTGIVLGAGGGALEAMLAPFRAFVGGPIGDGRQWVSWIHLSDMVRALERMIEDATLEGPVNAVAPHPVTMNTFARALGEALHRPTIMRVPSFALKLAMGKGRADALLTGQRVLPKKLQNAGFTFRFADVGSALTDILR